jgi:shikimate kinase
VGKARIFLIGASGSGKSVIGERVAELTGWSFIDTDADIVRNANGLRIADIFDDFGEDHFRELERQVLGRIEQIAVPVVVATGGGLPIIPGAMRQLKDAGDTVYLKADLDTLWKRLSMDPRHLEDRPLLRHHGKEALSKMLLARDHIYSLAAATLDTASRSVDEVCALLVARIRVLESSH